MHTVSVILPVYNGERYLSEALAKLWEARLGPAPCVTEGSHA